MGSTAIDFGKNRGKISIVESLSAVDPLCCRKIWYRKWKECLSAMIKSWREKPSPEQSRKTIKLNTNYLKIRSFKLGNYSQYKIY